MRTSLYKERILNLLTKKHLLTIAEIHQAIPDADYSTVFRNIGQLLRSGRIRKVMTDNRSVTFESSENSHDHFICNDCGTVESIHIPRNSIEGRTVNDITVRGSCGKCID